MMRISPSVLVLATATLALAGCGGGTSSSGVAHLPGSSGGATAHGGASSSSPKSSASTQQKMVAYSQCMRSHGVPEFPEPTEGHLLIHSGNHNGHAVGINPGSSRFQAAQRLCGKLLPNGGVPNAAEQAKAQESALKFSACMRAHGVPNFPDPTFGAGGRVSLRLTATGNGGIDPNSPEFKAAQQACQSIQPGLRGPGGGGPATSSRGSGASAGSAVAVP